MSNKENISLKLDNYLKSIESDYLVTLGNDSNIITRVYKAGTTCFIVVYYKADGEFSIYKQVGLADQFKTEILEQKFG